PLQWSLRAESPLPPHGVLPMRTDALLVFAALALVPSLSAARPTRHRPPAFTPPPVVAPDPTIRSPQTPGDIALAYRIEERLGDLRGVDLRDVHLRVVRGAVTLNGTIPDEAMRDKILIAANSPDGVVVVRDELSLDPSVARGGGPSDDAQIVV